MNNLLRQSELFLKRNASTILTCIGGAGVIATSAMAVKATPKALKLIKKAREEKGENLTKLEVVKIAGPAYIPAIITGVSTIACIFGANAFNKRQQAALMSAYALIDNSYKEYRKKVETLYGNEANSNVRKELAKDKYAESREDDICDEDDGKQLFYDSYSERYFRATNETVLKAEYTINEALHKNRFVCLNEFYDLLGIEAAVYGDVLGWFVDDMYETSWSSWIDFEHEKVEMEDGMECCIISMTGPSVYGNHIAI